MQLHLENPIFPKADIRILMTFVAGKNDELGLKADSHLSQISAILPLVRKADIMCKKFTPDELNKMDHETKMSSARCRTGLTDWNTTMKTS